ncbi:MAG: hypothetical protein J6N72_02290 [Psychrobacter sp.]|nr:hypothetical protein [Psychrobacter sp.]
MSLDTAIDNIPTLNHDEPADIIASIAKPITLMGWEVQIHDSNAKSKYDCDIYAQKDKGKIAVNVCFDAIDMADIKRRQAVLKEVGIRGLWLIKPCDGATCAISDRNDYLSNQIPIFTIMQNTGITLIHGMQYFDDGSLGDAAAFHEVPIDPYSFAYFLFSKILSFKPKYDSNVFLHCGIQDKICFKCQNQINTVMKVVYTRRIFGEFIHEDYSQACSVREVRESEIDLINRTFSSQYNFAPIKTMFSKFTQTHYMANSCSHCGVLMGAFFEQTDYFKPVVFTDMIASTMSAESCFWDNELDDGTGAWMLDNKNEVVNNIVEDLLDLGIIDFNKNGYYPVWFSLMALPDYEDDEDDD